MEFRIADSFTAALTKLTRDEQKAVKTSVFDLQTNPEHPGLKWHRIGDSKDPNFWSCRAGRDIRIVVHKTAQSFLLAYVGHHDDAYTWAGRRRIEAHPKTGAIQVVEVRKRAEEVVPPRPVQQQLDLGDGVEAVADEIELDDAYATERHLFYVACTRARDRLLVSGLRPGSEFLGDLRAQ